MTSIFRYRLHFPHLAKYRNIAHFKRLTFNLHLYAFPCSAYHFPSCTPHERHDRAFIARRTHRNGEPSFGAYQHKDHPNLRQNHRPEDKPRHGNLVAQVGRYGEEYLPSHLIKNRIPMKEERNIITMDGQGNISLPSDIGATAMTEWEICEPFGAAKVRRALLDRIIHGRKEKTTVFVSVVSDGKPNSCWKA